MRVKSGVAHLCFTHQGLKDGFVEVLDGQEGALVEAVFEPDVRNDVPRLEGLARVPAMHDRDEEVVQNALKKKKNGNWENGRGRNFGVAANL